MSGVPAVAEARLPQIYPWQMEPWQQLRAQDEAGRLPHAMLFSGPQGIGKERFARALAAALLCARPAAAGACGHCEGCTLLLAGSHPDLRELSPAEGKRQIQVDQVRALIEFCAQTAYRDGGRKVVVITPAEAMNINTANALLKTLEEPAGDTVLLLVSHAPSLLLPTVRSRCRSLPFALPPQEQALSWLSALLPDVQVPALLAEAGGRPLAALALYESEGLQARADCDQLLGEIAAGKLSALAGAERLLEQDIEFVMDWLTLRLNALGRLRLAASDEALPAPWPQWSNVPAQRIYSLLQQVLELRRQFQRGVAINKRLAMEALLLEWLAAWS